MDNHPIPQDVTGFQFKLIGDMTVKQFAYLASGSVLAWIFFSLPLFALIKFPLVFIFVLFGVSFAFISVGGRPVDTMMINFIKATFNPTQYIYERQSFVAPQNPAPLQKAPQLNKDNTATPTTFSTLHGGQDMASFHSNPVKNKLDQKEFDFFKMLGQMLNPVQSTQTAAESAEHHIRPNIISGLEEKERKEAYNSAQEQKIPVAPTPQPQVQVLDQQTVSLERALEEARVEEQKDQGSQLYETAHQKVLDIEKLLNETMSQKQQLENELSSLKKQLEQSKKTFYTASDGLGGPSVSTQTQNVRTISADQGKSAGFPIAPEFPNIITGIVKDPRGNPIPNVLVEVKDKEGNPVRAFKTNGVGQFSASTPLTNGSYTIEFEDSKSLHKFDAISFTATGEIILPIEVISQDLREELRKSLFS